MKLGSIFTAYFKSHKNEFGLFSDLSRFFSQQLLREEVLFFTNNASIFICSRCSKPISPYFLLNQTFSPIEPAAFEAEDVIIKSCRGNDNKNPTTVKNNTKNMIIVEYA